jgi:hypothetical protein
VSGEVPADKRVAESNFLEGLLEVGIMFGSMSALSLFGYHK